MSLIRNLLTHLVDHISRRWAEADAHWASLYADMGGDGDE